MTRVHTSATNHFSSSMVEAFTIYLWNLFCNFNHHRLYSWHFNFFNEVDALITTILNEIIDLGICFAFGTPVAVSHWTRLSHVHLLHENISKSYRALWAKPKFTRAVRDKPNFTQAFALHLNISIIYEKRLHISFFLIWLPLIKTVK